MLDAESSASRRKRQFPHYLLPGCGNAQAFSRVRSLLSTDGQFDGVGLLNPNDVVELGCRCQSPSGLTNHAQRVSAKECRPDGHPPSAPPALDCLHEGGHLGTPLPACMPYFGENSLRATT